MFDVQMKILIVDDMKTMRMFVKKNLATLGYKNVVEASDGQAGWEALEYANSQGSPVQFILSDWNMPKMSGIELLQKVRANNTFKKLPFVLITAENEKSQVVAAAQSGVNGYITKPFDAETLKDRMLTIYSKQNVA